MCIRDRFKKESKPNEEEEIWLDNQEVANLLRISTKTLQRLRKEKMCIRDSNTAALTGESVPRTLYKQEEVLAGMIASDKVVRIKVKKPYDQSTLARILTLVPVSYTHLDVYKRQQIYN